MTIVVARPEIARALQQKWASQRSVRIYQDCDAVAVLQIMAKTRPDIIALDPLFTATPRGAALIARIKADLRHEGADIRLLVVDEPAKLAALRDTTPCTGVPVPAIIATLSRPLDWCGTRGALRVPIAPDAPAAINGEPTLVVDLSTSGVQLLSQGRLRPAQGFRLTLVADEREFRMSAVVAWAQLQGSTAAPRYRAGASFVRSNESAIQAFCRRYGLEPEHLFVNRVGQPALTLQM